MVGGSGRKLAAILAADVFEYSRLMAEDEARTIAQLKVSRELMGRHILQHGGRVVDAVGDNLLADFPSVVDAVACAVTIQSDLAEENESLPAERRMLFRIGVNLGDVVVEGDRIYGSGINISARIEAMAHPGGVSISGTAFDQVEGKLGLRFESLGEHNVKNIPRPVRIYRVDVAAAQGVPLSRTVPGFSGRPAIAVLPFDDLTHDTGREFFADGISEDLIARLSAWRYFPVIARSSVFTYKGNPARAQEVARDLGVRYVVSGSVRRSGERLRVLAQLVDATSGHELWTGRYDRDLGQVFAIQDEIASEICSAIEPELRRTEAARTGRKDPQNLDAWECVHRGLWHAHTRDKEEVARACSLYRRAIEMDDGFAHAHAQLALARVIDLTNGWAGGDALEEAQWAAERAVYLDPRDPSAHHALSTVSLVSGDVERSILEGREAIRLDPSCALGYFGLGSAVALVGPAEEALAMLQKAVRLSPRDPLVPSFHMNMANAYFMAEQYEEAVGCAKRCLPQRRHNPTLRATLVASLSHLGSEAEAREELAALIEIAPSISQSTVKRFMASLGVDQGFQERMLDGLERAGLKG
jgi:adenylate cyclase